MEAATIYESLSCLAVVILLASLWYWSLNLSRARAQRELQDAIAQQQKMENPAHEQFDQDTGLHTFPFFSNQVDDYFHRAQAPVTEQKEILLIRLIDLDAMEYSFGFARTEMIIHRLSQQLKKIIDAKNNALASYAGHGTFAVFIDPDHATELLDLLDQPYTGICVNLVAGSASWPEQGRSLSKLMRHAETALLVGRMQHKIWLAYEPDMEPGQLDLEIISRFAEGNMQGIYPVFQPQLNLHTGKIESAEALVRWHCSRMGDIPPMAFIPLLEMAGLIEQITHLMLESAVQLAVKLRQHNLHCAISVNVTRYDLLDTTLVEFIQLLFKRHQGNASDLRLEFTGNFNAGDFHKLKKVLGELDEIGVVLALDHVGAGNMPLESLGDLPITELHIDRHYVGDMLVNSQHEKIVRAGMSVARELELRVLAEGVEDDKTLQLLKAEACDLAQGYVIARPMDETHFVEFMQAHGINAFEVR